MGSHPLNLTIRFLLELLALGSTGFWGWHQTDHWIRFILAITIPIGFAVIWGVFAVPNDPSRSGSAPIVTSGIVRLAIEFCFFGFAIWALKDLGRFNLSLVMGITVILHYIISYDRVYWLLSKNNKA